VPSSKEQDDPDIGCSIGHTVGRTTGILGSGSDIDALAVVVVAVFVVFAVVVVVVVVILTTSFGSATFIFAFRTHLLATVSFGHQPTT